MQHGLVFVRLRDTTCISGAGSLVSVVSCGRGNEVEIVRERKDVRVSGYCVESVPQKGSHISHFWRQCQWSADAVVAERSRELPSQVPPLPLDSLDLFCRRRTENDRQVNVQGWLVQASSAVGVQPDVERRDDVVAGRPGHLERL